MGRALAHLLDAFDRAVSMAELLVIFAAVGVIIIALEVLARRRGW